METTQDPIAQELAREDPEARIAAILQIARNPRAQLSDGALAALLQCLGATHKAVQRRAVDALAAIAERDTRVLPALRAALGGNDQRTRWAAAYALGLIGDALDLTAQKTLLEALSNPDGDVRWAAAELVVRLGHESPDEIRLALIELGGHPDHHARKMALYCLRDLKFADPQVRTMVENASRSAEPTVRLAALSLLANLSDADDEAIAIAMRCLESDPTAGVRRAAASALGHLGRRSNRARDALARAAAQAHDASLRKAARQALQRMEES
jgi:HEAT repeat protein